MAALHTPAWVVENYLPDYAKRHREEYINNARTETPVEVVEQRFVDAFFVEAMENMMRQMEEKAATAFGRSCAFNKEDYCTQGCYEHNRSTLCAKAYCPTRAYFRKQYNKL